MDGREIDEAVAREVMCWESGEDSLGNRGWYKDGERVVSRVPHQPITKRAAQPNGYEEYPEEWREAWSPSSCIKDAWEVLTSPHSHFRFLLDLNSGTNRWKLEKTMGRVRLVWFEPGDLRKEGPWVKTPEGEKYQATDERLTSKAISLAALKAVRGVE